ncbi:photosystem I P700 chlorophyll a apoprotein A2 [Iris pallida]|uniref:Photosystem I P700 chlorophyll a apoprotein A2 (Plastid) n=1 Tax=Iris pallida TaxID=29817 RepID=A0AAX6IM82_IRIPA|nr:photosystem I P700 chlorophyll a apoprotein A2 [Iris pallida]
MLRPALNAGPVVEDKSTSKPYEVLPCADCIHWANIGSIKICFSGVPKASMTSL